MGVWGQGRKQCEDLSPQAPHRVEKGRSIRNGATWELKIPDTTQVTALAERLEKLPQVEAAAPQIPFHASVVTPDDPEFQNGNQWNLDSPIYDEARYSTSNYGPRLDLVAPGTGYPSTKRGGGVIPSITGTSFSAPMVAGVAGLILSESRDRGLGLTNDDIQHLMEQTADDLGPSGRDDEYGHGRVNAHKALQALQPPNTVTHASVTGGAATNVWDDHNHTFINSGDGLASDTYYGVETYEVTGYVTFDSVYLYHLRAGSFTATKQLVVVK